MWLLDAETYELVSFEGDSTESYAIVSHRWDYDEVTFKEVKKGKGRTKKGWQKIKMCCKQAIEDRIPFIWIDTCCIDKTSSTELSESINSMYRWYKNAKVCYAYLQDVLSLRSADFESSDWFNRGWTLQELLAPKQVKFYNCSWLMLGTRSYLRQQIANITDIPAYVLSKSFDVHSKVSIADRMSWASRRETTRVEDSAYSLLGLFGISMPLLYGEGSRAFRRLQEEILKVNDDLSILAWGASLPDESINGSDGTGLLAGSVACFDIQQMRKSLSPMYYEEEADYKFDYQFIPTNSTVLQGTSLSNTGLTISLPVVPYFLDTYFVPLLRTFPEKAERTKQELRTKAEALGIFIARRPYANTYHRLHFSNQCLFPSNYHNVDMNLISPVQKTVVLGRGYIAEWWHKDQPVLSTYGFHIGYVTTNPAFTSVELYSRFDNGNNRRKLWLQAGSCGVAGIVRLDRLHKPTVFLLFGFNDDFDPFCLAVRSFLAASSHPTPNQIVFSVQRVGMNSISLWDDDDIMDLVTEMASDTNYVYQIDRDGVELHSMKRGSTPRRFSSLVTDVGIVTFSRWLPGNCMGVDINSREDALSPSYASLRPDPTVYFSDRSRDDWNLQVVASKH